VCLEQPVTDEIVEKAAAPPKQRFKRRTGLLLPCRKTSVIYIAKLYGAPLTVFHDLSAQACRTGVANVANTIRHVMLS
tara:strand:+ start:193 stop:426 length:234 start_codon:yes stop_codon:yes gene_type:complete